MFTGDILHTSSTMLVMKVTLALLLLTLPLAAMKTPAVTIQVHATKLEWKATKPPLPTGTELAVLEGDPKQPGMFMIRPRIPAGANLAAHTHPVVERVTVLSGEVHVGFRRQAFDARHASLRGGRLLRQPARRASLRLLPEDDGHPDHHRGAVDGHAGRMKIEILFEDDALLFVNKPPHRRAARLRRGSRCWSNGWSTRSRSS